MSGHASIHTLYCSDDFVRANATSIPASDGWASDGKATWGVSIDGVRPASSVQECGIVIPRTFPSAYSVEALVSLPDPNGSIFQSLVGKASYSDGKWTHYMAYLNGAKNLGIYRQVAGASSILVRQTVDVDPTAPHLITLSIDGGNVRATLDDALSVSGTDASPISGGGPGLATTYATPRYSDFVCYAGEPSTYNSLWTDFVVESVKPTTSTSSNVVKVPGSNGGVVQIAPSSSRIYNVRGHFLSGDVDIEAASNVLRSLSQSGKWAYLRSPYHKVCGVMTKLRGPTYTYGGRRRKASFSFDLIEAQKPR